MDEAGVGGRIVTDPGTDTLVRVRLDDGTIIAVEEHELERRADGTDRVDGRWMDLAETVSVPRIEERVQVGKRRVPRATVVLHKRVLEEDITVDEPLMEDDVEVERVRVDQFVDAPPGTRREGETLIIPILEEVIVYEKRLRLREELHVRRVRREASRPAVVTARREEIEVQEQPNHREEKES